MSELHKCIGDVCLSCGNDILPGYEYAEDDDGNEICCYCAEELEALHKADMEASQ